MSLMVNFQQGMRSLALHRMRTLLSTLGVLFGVVSVISMLSIGEGAKMETLAQIEHLGMNSVTIRQNAMGEEQQQKVREHRSYGLTVKDGDILKKSVPNVDSLAMLKVVETPIQAVFVGLSPEVLAVTHSYGKVKGLEIAEGRFLCDLDLQKKSRVCALGSEVAKSLGKYGHEGQILRIDNEQFLIVGVLKTKQWKQGKTNALTSRNLNKSLFIPLGVEMTLPQAKQTFKQEALSEITMQIAHSNKMPQSIGVIKRVMQAAHSGVEDYQIVVPQELLDQAYRTQYTFNLVLGSIAAISLLVGGIGIMNIMLATVSERTREIGIRRAVGANKRHIAYQFLAETMLLTFVGAFLGVIIGIIFSFLIGHFAGWMTVVTWWSILLSMGMACIVGGISGLYPALKAAQMNPITALRHD
jgi:putative ABC transport system permease protein